MASVETVATPYIKQKIPTWIANTLVFYNYQITDIIVIQETNQAWGYEHNSVVAKPSKVKGHLNPIIVPENKRKCK